MRRSPEAVTTVSIRISCEAWTPIMTPNTFLSFQGVRDKLYQHPLEIKGHAETLTAYLGALGFTKLVE